MLLALNNSKEVFSFGFGLSGVRCFTFLELAFASDFEFVSLALQLFLLRDFFAASLAFTFFESAFSAEGVDFGLAISGFLLLFAKAGNFTFFFFFEAAFFESLGDFTFDLGLVVINDLLFLLKLTLSNLLLLSKCNLISSLNLSNKSKILLTLLLSSSNISKALILNLLSHLLLLLNFHFLLFDALNLTLLNLVDDDESAFAASVHTYFLTFFLHFEAFQTFDFHHEIEFFLFFDPFALELFVFFELFVTDGHDFRVEHHLVHVFHVVELFIKLSLCFRKDTNILISLGLLNIIGLNLSSALSIKSHHSLFTCFRFLLSGFLLFASKSSSHLLLLMSLDLGGALNTVHFVLCNHSGLVGWLLLNFLADGAEHIGRYNRYIFLFFL